MSDEEKNPMLRKLRNKIGYGVGWTFKAALWDKTQFWLVLILIWLAALWLMSHIKIVWIP